MYIIKFEDKKRGEWTYIAKGSVIQAGHIGAFLEPYVFKSKNEAKRHMRKVLHSGWYRPEYRYRNFKIVRVCKYPGWGSFWMDEEYKNELERDIDDPKTENLR